MGSAEFILEDRTQIGEHAIKVTKQVGAER
jgi:hypothetical protein